MDIEEITAIGRKLSFYLDGRKVVVRNVV